LGQKLLKQKVGGNVFVITVMPEFNDQNPRLQPLTALDYRGNIHNRDVFIHWQGFSLADVTWESLSGMKVCFPDFVLKDNDAFNGEKCYKHRVQ
jgi:hypothetical protein